MQPRLNYLQIAPETMKLAVALESHLAKSGIEQRSIELVKMRASQINGCAYLPAHAYPGCPRPGETEERLYLLDAWRESPLYTAARTRRAGLDRGADPGVQTAGRTTTTTG